MIIVKIHGGLGNQMFQYALGRNLSLIHNVPFKIDSSYLLTANQFGRSFQLDTFNTVLEEATAEDIRAYRSTFHKVLDRLLPESYRKKVSDIGEDSDRFDKNVLKRADGYFDGHWNSEGYFKNNAKIIKVDFTLKNPLGNVAQQMSEKITAENNPVSIHIRRTDYISIQKASNIFTSLPFSYYENAIKKVLENYPDAHFFISSDDIVWVKENFPKNYPVTFLPSNEIPPYDELTLQSLCKHNIIANSSFSWWGAYLNSNPTKMVIAPQHWFKDNNKNQNGIIPQNWIKM